ncbi:sigma-70 family RNA polymerase sigma factor [Granulicella sp. WH15]|uniref:sigma-70 family RNA polymerase sigma factor n=1 Tax=Granulicella sp. WH15 TaxID=2602070 RepID=UPI001366EBBB|nr:sigma-70 family RNA polymerase sigma factor [Granulicella sp. WH15]QHN03364.1 sigma-70 family RNA polymerase sigma factor [Granulicella sp. WH15]
MYGDTGVLNGRMPAPQDDAALLALVQRGDEAAMATIFDRYGKIAYSVALRVLRDPALAEEVLQELFMQLWRSTESFTAAASHRSNCLPGRLAIASRNRSIALLRLRQPTDQEDGISPLPPCNLADESARDAIIERVRDTVRTLPAGQRKTLEMAFFDGLTHAEIAEVTSDQPEAVKARIRGTLLTVREALQL